MFQVKAILSISLILFTVIDILGSLPVILNMKKQGINIHAGQATVVAGLLMVAFLFFGVSMLGMFGIAVESFALAGSLIIFFIGLEMTLNIRIFREDQEASSGTIVPIAFPILAGAGTLTTIISLKSQYESPSIVAGIILNLIVIFIVLRTSNWIGKKIGDQGVSTLRKVFGIILIAIAFEMFRANWG